MGDSKEAGIKDWLNVARGKTIDPLVAAAKGLDEKTLAYIAENPRKALGIAGGAGAAAGLGAGIPSGYAMGSDE